VCSRPLDQFDELEPGRLSSLSRGQRRPISRFRPGSAREAQLIAILARRSSQPGPSALRRSPALRSAKVRQAAEPPPEARNAPGPVARQSRQLPRARVLRPRRVHRLRRRAPRVRGGARTGLVCARRHGESSRSSSGALAHAAGALPSVGSSPEHVGGHPWRSASSRRRSEHPRASGRASCAASSRRRRSRSESLGDWTRAAVAIASSSGADPLVVRELLTHSGPQRLGTWVEQQEQAHDVWAGDEERWPSRSGVRSVWRSCGTLPCPAAWTSNAPCVSSWARGRAAGVGGLGEQRRVAVEVVGGLQARLRRALDAEMRLAVRAGRRVAAALVRAALPSLPRRRRCPPQNETGQSKSAGAGESTVCAGPVFRAGRRAQRWISAPPASPRCAPRAGELTGVLVEDPAAAGAELSREPGGDPEHRAGRRPA